MGKNICIITLVCFCLLFSTSCATIFSSDTYNVLVNSKEPGMQFVVLDRKKEAVVARGITPQYVTLKSSRIFFWPEKYNIVFNTPGEPTVVPCNAHIDPWYFVDLVTLPIPIITAIVMLIIEPYSGAMYKLDSSYSLEGQK